LFDDREDTLGALDDVVVPEAQDAEATRAKEGITVAVVGNLRCMAVSVRLDDQLAVDAGEVGVVGTYGMLPAEVVAALTEAVEDGPQLALGLGRVAAELAGAFGGRFVLRCVTTPTPVPSP
jgi:hypothetical protein